MSFVKKLSAGAWISCCAAVLTLVALIVYAVNISGAGYFQHASVSNLVATDVIALVLLLAVIGLAQVELAGNAKIILDLVSGCCQIVAPVLLTLSLLNLAAARVEGLGFIYFSNADVLLEVQTPANLSSASGAIANMVLLGVAMLVAMVAAFCTIRKKEKK